MFLCSGNYGKPVEPVILPADLERAIRSHERRDVFKVIELYRLSEHVPLPRDHRLAAVFMYKGSPAIEIFWPEIVIERVHSGRTSTGDRFDIALKYHHRNTLDLVDLVIEHSLVHNL